MYLTSKQRKNLYGDLKMKTIADKTFELSSKCGTHTVHTFHEPNLLDELKQDFIFSQCANVALDAFSQNPSEMWEDDIRAHVIGEPVLHVLMSEGTLRWRGVHDVEIGEGRAIAWCSMRYIDTSRSQMAYVSGITVSTAWAGKGIGQALMKHAFKNSDLFSLRTQSPIMAQAFYRSVQERAKHVYPLDRYDGSQALADEISQKLKMSGIDHRLMFSGIYGGSLYGVPQECRNNFGNDIFNPEMQIKGDAYLCLAL